MKRCFKCGEEKDLSEFASNVSRKDGKQNTCKTCKSAYMQAHYVNNKQGYLERAQAQKQKTREWLRTYKEAHPCTDCGTHFPFYVMEFDHLGDDVKLNEVSRLVSFGLNKVMTEIAKCELVCANCHRVRTWKRLDTSAQGAL